MRRVPIVDRVEEALTEDDVDHFIRKGVVLLKGGFPRSLADECRRLLWEDTGCDEHDRSTWNRPVIRIEGRGDGPFIAAINTARLQSAFDRLAGIGRWVPRTGVGTFPIRFPSDEEPGDDGWHIESTGTGFDGKPVVDPRSRVRVLLLLMLFSDTGSNDAPTRIRLGSHLDAARCLFANDHPSDFLDTSRELAIGTKDLPEALATGEAGDVWLCHPFVVHAAQRHRGDQVKFMGQPPLGGVGPIDPMRTPLDRSPVEQAVSLALG